MPQTVKSLKIARYDYLKTAKAIKKSGKTEAFDALLNHTETYGIAPTLIKLYLKAHGNNN